MSVSGRFKNAWNAFMNRDPTNSQDLIYGSSMRQDRTYRSYANYRTIMGTIFNLIAIDCSAIGIRHVRLDDDDNYESDIKDSLDYALNKSANIDQTGRELIQDAVESMLDEGVIAIIPSRADPNPNLSDSYKIYELRVGKILEWFPRHIRVELYDEDVGYKKQIVVEKRIAAIIQNPFFTIMNEPNSTHQRLTRTLAQLDRSNEINSSDKLELILQFPYSIKTHAKKILARDRVRELSQQLSGSKYGIGYIDSAEKIVQLNRSLENNLWEQAKELNEDLFNQMGLSREVFSGTASEQVMLNYYNRTVEPILSTIVENMERKWLTPTAVSQKQAIRYFRNPFKLVPVGQLAEITDKFTRNEVMTSNEFRSVIGRKPSSDPKADMLLNSNLNHPEEEIAKKTTEIQNE